MGESADEAVFLRQRFLAGANFEYHARPLSILLARAVVLLLVVVGGAVAVAYSAAGAARYSFLLFLLLPWALVRGFSFNARNSSYRGLRFSFARRYGEAYFALFGLPMLLLWFRRRRVRYGDCFRLPCLVFARLQSANHALGDALLSQSRRRFGADFRGNVVAFRFVRRRHFCFSFCLIALRLFALSVMRAMLFKAWAGVQIENGACGERDISYFAVASLTIFSLAFEFWAFACWQGALSSPICLVAAIAIDSLRLGEDRFVPKAGDAADTRFGRDAVARRRRFGAACSFEFRGRTGEYFRIWIVNVFDNRHCGDLFAVGEMRTKRYTATLFAAPISNCAHFRFFARAACFCWLSFAVLPLTAPMPMRAILAVFADVGARARFSFNARNSSYRGLRFSFARRYGEAYFVLFALPTLLLALFWSGVERTPPGFAAIGFVVVFFMLITFAAFLPYFVFRYYRFKVANHALGRTRFVFAQFPEPYYFALLAPTFILINVVAFRWGRIVRRRRFYFSFRFIAFASFRFVRSARDVV